MRPGYSNYLRRIERQVRGKCALNLLQVSDGSV